MAVTSIGVKMKQSSQETRISLLEQAIIHVHETMLRIETKMERMDEKIDKMRDKMDNTAKWYFALGISVFFSAATLALSVYKVV